MSEFLRLFETSRYPARWLCGDWPAALGWSHIIFDGLTGLAYFFGFGFILYWLHGQKTSPSSYFTWFLTALFFLFCGLSHFVFAIQFWYPIYWFDGIFIKPLQAIISMTAFTMLFFWEKPKWLNPKETSDQLLLFRLVAEAANPFYVVDTDGKCTCINNGALSLLGYSCKEEVLGQNMHFLIHHSKADGSPYPLGECKIFHCMQTRLPTTQQNDIIWTKKGKNIFVDWASTPLIDQYGEMLGARVEIDSIESAKTIHNDIKEWQQNDR